MNEVQGFDSLDEMFDAMGKAENAANADMLPGQIRLRDDVENTRYWVHALPEIDLVVYGRADATWRVQAESGFDAAENRSRGYLTGIAYSVAAESGEYGDQHVSQVVPISLDTFVLAKSLGWPTFSALRDEDNRILGRALAQHEADARK